MRKERILEAEEMILAMADIVMKIEHKKRTC